MRIIVGIYPPQSANPIFRKYNILKIGDIAKLQMLIIMHKHTCNQLPLPIKQIFIEQHDNIYSTRLNKHFESNYSTKNYRLSTIACHGPKLWNDIMTSRFTRNEVPHSKNVVKKILKKYFIETYQ